MSDVFGFAPGDDRLDAEVSAEQAERAHRRSLLACWSAGTALVASILLLVVAVSWAIGRGDPPPVAAVVAAALVAAAMLCTLASVLLVVVAVRRRCRVVTAVGPEGGVVVGVSEAGVNLAHLPLLEWRAVDALVVARRPRRGGGRVTVGMAVSDVDAVRARIIDTRHGPSLRATERRFRGPTTWGDARRGMLVVRPDALLDPETAGRVVERLERESRRRSIPVVRTGPSGILRCSVGS